jgi:hypothetical protein
MGKYTKSVPLVFKREVPMEHSSQGKIWGIVCGLCGGLPKFFLQAETISFPHKLMEAGVTALLCGVAGALGKKLVDLAWPHTKALLAIIKSKLFKAK